MLNLCNRLLHKFLGDTILFYWIKWPILRSEIGILRLAVKMDDLVMFWFIRLKADFINVKH